MRKKFRNLGDNFRELCPFYSFYFYAFLPEILQKKSFSENELSRIWQEFPEVSSALLASFRLKYLR